MEIVERFNPVIKWEPCFVEPLQTPTMELDEDGEWVRYRDFKELSEYADTLAQGLPCLPKDIEVLRSANAALAQRVFELENLLQN